MVNEPEEELDAFERKEILQSEIFTQEVDFSKKMHYQEIVAETERRNRDTYKDGEAFSIHWPSVSGPRKEALRTHLKGKTVIDLFASRWYGDFGDGCSFIQQIADECEAARYIAEDRYMDPEEDDRDKSPWNVKNEELKIKQPPSGMPVDYCNGDGLLSLAHLPDNAENIVIFINGVESCNLSNPDLHWALAEEIVRVLPEGGVVGCMEANASQHFEELGLQLLPEFGPQAKQGLPQLWIKPKGHQMPDLAHLRSRTHSQFGRAFR